MTELPPFPAQSHMRWQRLDVPGHEEARIVRTPAGWNLTGRVEVDEAGVHAQLAYVIECDDRWRTRRATVTGQASSTPLLFEFTADGAGEWTLNNVPLDMARGALDLDLGFTPATNLLPVRRLDLPVGACAQVRTTWVRFPELRVEMLDQSYERESPGVFRYDALVDGEPFQARLHTDQFGRVLLYEGLWKVVA